MIKSVLLTTAMDNRCGRCLTASCPCFTFVQVPRPVLCLCGCAELVHEVATEANIPTCVLNIVMSHEGKAGGSGFESPDVTGDGKQARDVQLGRVVFVNRMFDILNGWHPNEASNTRNEDLAPFRSTDDARLKWLEEDCLCYFDNWKKVVEAMPLAKYEKQRRLLSRQTRNGIEITIKGFTAAVRHIWSQPDARRRISLAASSTKID